MNYMTVRDVSQVLGVKPYQVVYAITAGHVPEPCVRIVNKRVFDQGDVEGLRAYFKAKMRGRSASLKGN